MQIQILKPSANGKYYPNYDEMIRNSCDEDERKYLEDIKQRNAERKAKGYKHDLIEGFAFGLIYTQKMACGHYEIFQHPIYRDFMKEPTEDDILDSLEHMICCIRQAKRDKMECTRCTCNLERLW